MSPITLTSFSSNVLYQSQTVLPVRKAAVCSHPFRFNSIRPKTEGKRLLWCWIFLITFGIHFNGPGRELDADDGQTFHFLSLRKCSLLSKLAPLQLFWYAFWISNWLLLVAIIAYVISHHHIQPWKWTLSEEHSNISTDFRVAAYYHNVEWRISQVV